VHQALLGRAQTQDHIILVARGSAIPFSILLDGAPVTASQGTDVDADGRGTVRAQETYQLVRQRGEIRERRFEIEFHEGGLEAYCFTFG
jgi:hypothetical protein